MKLVFAMLLVLPATALAQEYTSTPSSQANAPVAASAAPSPRRPSMVGYINDSSIGSEIRVRFDAGFDITAADRAEFFYGKCGCYRGLAPNDPAFDPDAAGPGPGVLTSTNFQQLYLYGEYAFAGRGSLFGELPVRVLKPQTFAPGTGSFPDATGVSDFRFGAKAGLISMPARRLTASLQLSAPTGDSRKGLGTNHWSVEPALLYLERPTDRFTIEAQLGDIIPTSGSAGVPISSASKFSGSVLYYGVGPSYEVYRSASFAFAPVVELVGWRVLGGFQTASASDATGTNIVNLKVGGRLLFGTRGSLYVGYGHALTDATWYDDIVRVEYRIGL